MADVADKKKPADGCRVVEFLSGLTAADLAEIDQRIETLKRQLAALEAARRLIDVQVNGPPERKRPGPKKSQAPAGNGQPAASGNGVPTDPAARNAMQSQRRLAVARLLSKSGPLGSTVIANRCDIPAGSITSVLACDWFQGTDNGYRLTEVGRRESGI